MCEVARMREREGGEEAPAGARTWMTTPDAKQQVRSKLAMHARQRSSERR